MLTKRQLEFLALYGAGVRIPQIAESRFVSQWTVINTLKAARERLDAPTITAAVTKAIALELLVLDHEGGVTPTIPEKKTKRAAAA